MTDPRLTAVHTKVSGLSALYFPQLQDAICMTNSPGWLTMVIAMFRKILPKKNLEKIVVYSGVTSLWKSEWGKKMLRKEGLPSSCGGTLPDSEVPESFFGKFGGCEDDSPCQTTLTVGSGKVETVEIQIPNPTPMTEAHLYVVMEGHGVNVSANFKGDTQITSRELLESTKCKYEEGLLKRVWPITAKGKVVVAFDNTHSRFRSKTLKYGFWSEDKKPQEATLRKRSSATTADPVRTRPLSLHLPAGIVPPNSTSTPAPLPPPAAIERYGTALSFSSREGGAITGGGGQPKSVDSVEGAPLPYHNFKTASSWSGDSAGNAGVDVVSPNELSEMVARRLGTML